MQPLDGVKIIYIPQSLSLFSEWNIKGFYGFLCGHNLLLPRIPQLSRNNQCKNNNKKKYVPILMNNTQLTDKKQFNRLPWLHIYQMIYVLISTSKSSLRSAADRKVLVNFADLFDPQDQRDQGRARCIKDCRDRVSVVWSEIWDNSMSTFLYGMKKLYGDENRRWILPCFKNKCYSFLFSSPEHILISRDHKIQQKSHI